MSFSLYAWVCLCLLLTTQPSLSTPCSDLLERVKRLHESLPLVQSRIGWPSYQNKRFNIRIIGLNQPQFSPWEIRSKTKDMVESILTKYDEMGFEQTSFLQVIVEAELASIKKLEKLDPEGYILVRANNSTPWAARISEFTRPTDFIFLPGIFRYRPFDGRLEKGAYPRTPMTLVFPIWSISSHWFGDPAIMAHEIAHATEKDRSFKSRIWLEARADVLAALNTDTHLLRAPKGYYVLSHDEVSGKITRQDIDVEKDLLNPRIHHKKQVVPAANAHYQNSELVSHLLYQIGLRLGASVTIELIKKMDHDSFSQDVGSSMRYGYTHENGTPSSSSQDSALVELETILTNLRQRAQELSPYQANVIDKLISESGF